MLNTYNNIHLRHVRVSASNSFLYRYTHFSHSIPHCNITISTWEISVQEKYGKRDGCAGNDYQEPGAFHFFPNSEGESPLPMSFNGCKEVGCARFGMRKIRISPRVSYKDAIETYLIHTNGGDFSNISTITRPYKSMGKHELNGKLSVGAKFYQTNWLDRIPCLDPGDDIFNILNERRSNMQEAIKVYCQEKQYCKKPKPGVKRRTSEFGIK